MRNRLLCLDKQTFFLLLFTGTSTKAARNSRKSSPCTEQHQLSEVKKESDDDVDMPVPNPTEKEEIPLVIQATRTSNLALLYGMSFIFRT